MPSQSIRWGFSEMVKFRKESSNKKGLRTIGVECMKEGTENGGLLEAPPPPGMQNNTP